MTGSHGDTDAATGRTLWSLATDWAARRGDEDVLVHLPRPDSPDGMRSTSWQRLVQDVAQLRRALAAAGVADQRTVCSRCRTARSPLPCGWPSPRTVR